MCRTAFSLDWGTLAFTVVAPKLRKANFFCWTLDVAAQDPESLAEEKKEKRYTRTNWH